MCTRTSRGLGNGGRRATSTPATTTISSWDNRPRLCSRKSIGWRHDARRRGSKPPASGAFMAKAPIVVAGDITVDWLTWTQQAALPAFDPDDDTPNWRRHQITGRVARAGG